MIWGVTPMTCWTPPTILSTRLQPLAPWVSQDWRTARAVEANSRALLPSGVASILGDASAVRTWETASPGKSCVYSHLIWRVEFVYAYSHVAYHLYRMRWGVVDKESRCKVPQLRHVACFVYEPSNKNKRSDSTLTHPGKKRPELLPEQKRAPLTTSGYYFSSQWYHDIMI